MSRLTAGLRSSVSDANAAQLVAQQHEPLKPPRIPRASPLQGALWFLGTMVATGLVFFAALLIVALKRFLGWMFWP